MARFNRHRPALCADCTKPLSVRERRAGAVEGVGMLCAWDAHVHFREEFDRTLDASFWISEPSGPMIEDAEARVVTVDAADLFGTHGEEGGF